MLCTLALSSALTIREAAAQAPGPSAPAAVTNLPHLDAGGAHLSDDGLVVAYAAGAKGPTFPRLVDRWVLDLRPSASCALRANHRVSLEEESDWEVNLPQRQQSLSGNASSMVVDHELTGQSDSCGQLWKLAALDREADRWVDLISVPETVGGLPPNPVLAAEGRFVLYHAKSSAGPVCFDHAFILDMDSFGPPCDAGPSIPSAVTSQRAISADGSRLLIVSPRGADEGVFVTLNGCLVRTRLSPYVGTLTSAPTISADGTIGAWSSDMDHCSGGMTGSMDLWMWRQDGLDIPGATSCLAENGLGKLYRMGLSTVDERAPVLSADGRRILFISDGVYADFNPLGRQVLWMLTASTTDILSATSVSGQHTLDDPLDPAASGQVAAAAVDADASTAVYTVEFPDGRRDLRLVNVDAAGFARVPTSGRPASLPFEAELLSCNGPFGGQLQVQARLRQFRGGLRHVIVTFQAEDETGEFHSIPPLIQPIDDEEEVAMQVDIPVSGTTGTCRMLAWDGIPDGGDDVADSLAY